MMLEPRLLVAVHPAIFHRVGLPSTTRIPSHISTQKPLRPEAVPGAGAGSGRRMAQSDRTETAKEAASTAIALAAPTICRSRPAIAGPATCATLRLTSSLLLPSMSFDRGINAGR